MDESIILNFKQGSSDKVYNASLVEVPEGGYLVNFSYGRRGKPLRAGTKTPAPVSYEIAKRAYDKLVQEKKAKGYTEDSLGNPFQGSVQGVDRTDYLPQLLNPIEPDDIPEALSRAEGELYLQVKYDGERRMVIVNADGETFGSNRKGLRVELPDEIVRALQAIIKALPVERLVLDGEDMGDHLWIFDILEWGTEDLTERSFADRLGYLMRLDGLEQEFNTVRLAVPYQCVSLDDAAYFLQLCEGRNEEGIVLRDPRASYTPGRPNSWGPCLKIKFYATATCIVDSVHPTKSSIGLALLDTAGKSDKEKLTSVGNCTIPPNYTIPAEGDLVEIKYLYAYRGGSLYQPQYKGERTDLPRESASIKQLKYKD